MMTTRERWLATIRSEPVDHLPFYPKLNESYPRAQTAPFRSMEVDAIHDWIGSDTHPHIPPCTVEVRNTTCRMVQEDARTRQIEYVTPHGSTHYVEQFDEPSQSWYPVVHPVRSLEDVKLMTAFFDDCTIEPDREALSGAVAQQQAVNGHAATRCHIGTSRMSQAGWNRLMRRGLQTPSSRATKRAASRSSVRSSLRPGVSRTVRVVG